MYIELHTCVKVRNVDPWIQVDDRKARPKMFHSDNSHLSVKERLKFNLIMAEVTDIYSKASDPTLLPGTLDYVPELSNDIFAGSSFIQPDFYFGIAIHVQLPALYAELRVKQAKARESTI